MAVRSAGQSGMAVVVVADSAGKTADRFESPAVGERTVGVAVAGSPLPVVASQYTAAFAAVGIVAAVVGQDSQWTEAASVAFQCIAAVVQSLHSLSAARRMAMVDL